MGLQASFNKEQLYTKNIVYEKVFNNLPKVKTTSNIF